jgi:hypothetical protein
VRASLSANSRVTLSHAAAFAAGTSGDD